MKLNSIFREVKNIQNKLPDRQLTEPMTFLMEELGELSTEITIKMGIKDRIPGKDGINGEVIDSIICLMDILLMNNPNFNEAFKYFRDKGFKVLADHCVAVCSALSLIPSSSGSPKASKILPFSRGPTLMKTCFPVGTTSAPILSS